MLLLQRLGSETPLVLFKKIDSRLKGNVAAESIALASATDRGTIISCARHSRSAALHGERRGHGPRRGNTVTNSTDISRPVPFR